MVILGTPLKVASPESIALGRLIFDREDACSKALRRGSPRLQRDANPSLFRDRRPNRMPFDRENAACPVRVAASGGLAAALADAMQRARFRPGLERHPITAEVSYVSTTFNI